MAKNGALDPVAMGDDSHFAPQAFPSRSWKPGAISWTPNQNMWEFCMERRPLHSQFVTTTWLKNIAWKCTFTVFVDLSSDGLQLVGSKACLKDLTSIQANGICFIILNNKEISSINKEQEKRFPGSLLDPCV